MNILITGAGGFLGSMLARKIIENQYIEIDGKKHSISKLVLVDQISFAVNYHSDDFKIEQYQVNLTDGNNIKSLWNEDFDVVFHLAAVVSGQAEQEFDLGYLVNLDVTRNLLEVMRHQGKKGRFFMTSSVAVFGRNLPDIMPDSFPTLPLSSYGAQKAIAELLVMDYSRKGFCDGRILRLPTICVRPGKPNAAASSFVSSIMREPLNGEHSVCPVATDSRLWIMSPDKAILSMLHMIGLDESAICEHRIIHPMGLTVTVQQMLDALVACQGKEILQYITFEENQLVKDIVLSWPYAFASEAAKKLGFPCDQDMGEIITNYKKNNR